MDIDEFFSNLIDKLENRIKNSENENLIKYFFQGHINDVLTFQPGCDHHRTNTSNFYSIQLQIRNKKSLYESLDTLIEGELMNEDNCIMCPKCNKKMPAIKRAISGIPAPSHLTRCSTSHTVVNPCTAATRLIGR
jgi:ubiquitin carboxyl-terminal hydrolase 9/24